MKISIFGCGWLGLPLGLALSKERHEVKGLVRSENSFSKLKPTSIKPFQGEIEKLNDIDEDFFRCDLLIISLPHKDLINFENLKLKIENFQIKHVLYTSSTSVYANNNDWVNEDNGPVNDNSAIYKVEEILNSGNYNFTTFRMSGLVGGERHPGNFFQRSGRKIPQPTSGINMIHQKDCIGIIKAIINNEKWNEVYNGCSPDHSEKQIFYPEMAKLAGNPIPELDFSQAPNYKLVDGTKVTKNLGYNYQVNDMFKYFTNPY